MRMVAFVVECGKPTEIAHGYSQVFGERLCLRPEHIPPSAAVIIAKALGVLTAKRYDCRPHISRMRIEFIGYLLQIHRHTVIGKESVRADAFHTGTGGDVVGIGCGVHHFIGIFLKRTGNEFRSCSNRFILEIILILQGRTAVGKVREDFLYQLLLLICCRSISFRFIYFFNALTGSNVFRIAAEVISLIGLQIFEFRNKPCHSITSILPGKTACVFRVTANETSDHHHTSCGHGYPFCQSFASLKVKLPLSLFTSFTHSPLSRSRETSSISLFAATTFIVTAS